MVRQLEKQARITSVVVFLCCITVSESEVLLESCFKIFLIILSGLCQACWLSKGACVARTLVTSEFVFDLNV